MFKYEKANAPMSKDNISYSSKWKQNLSRSSHPAEILQRIRLYPESMTHADTRVLQKTIGNRGVCQLLKELSLVKPKSEQSDAFPQMGQSIQRQMDSVHMEVPTKVEKENKTGLPDTLKEGVESLTGLSMDNVRVHYNSDKPAKVGAFAYTQGTNIHVAPGQEKYLSHEAWHVVQQAQGRVRPTMQFKGMTINDDAGLEKEASEMGGKINRPILFASKKLDTKLEEIKDFPTSNMQLAINKQTSVEEFEKALGVSATKIYKSSKKIRDFVSKKINEDVNYIYYESQSNPQNLVAVKIERYLKLENNNLDKWVFNLNNYFMSDSTSGYDDATHSSIIASKKTHKDNWLKFTNKRLQKVIFKNLFENLKKKAELRLDNEIYKKLHEKANNIVNVLDKVNLYQYLKDAFNVFYEKVENKEVQEIINPFEGLKKVIEDFKKKELLDKDLKINFIDFYNKIKMESMDKDLKEKINASVVTKNVFKEFYKKAKIAEIVLIKKGKSSKDKLLNFNILDKLLDTFDRFKKKHVKLPDEEIENVFEELFKNLNDINELQKKAIDAAKNLDIGEIKDISSEINSIKEYSNLIDLKNKIKPKIPQWTTEKKYGTGISMHAEFVPFGIMPRGSGENIKTIIDWFYAGRINTDGIARYVKGHLLNDHVGGPAKNYNLSPLHEQANKKHEIEIESKLKEKVSEMQYAAIEGKAQLYKNIVYDVNLGPQSRRTGTEKWKTAYNFLLNLANKTLTIGDIKNDNRDLKDIIDVFKINDNKKISELIYSFKFNAFLWEVEDYLVRDWYVNLKINHIDGKNETYRLKLKNEKPENLDAPYKEPTDDIQKNMNKLVPEPEYKIPSHEFYDVEEISEDHPERIEYKLWKMSDLEYKAFMEYLNKDNISELPINKKDIEKQEDFHDIVIKESKKLAELLNNFNFKVFIENIGKERKDKKRKLDEISDEHKTEIKGRFKRRRLNSFN